MLSKQCVSGFVRRFSSKRSVAATVVQEPFESEKGVFIPRPHEKHPVLFREYEVKVSKLNNGMKVASVDNYKDTSHLHLVFNCGTRYETPETWGISQRVRNCIGAATENLAGVEIGNLLGEIGGQFNISTTREHMILSLDCLRSQVNDGIEFLGEMARPVFHSHAASDVREFSEYEAAAAEEEPMIKITDLLHAAAYGQKGLGNPLFVPNHVSYRFNGSQLQNFVDHHFVTGSSGFFGVGVDHAKLLEFASDSLQLHEGAGFAIEKSPYQGGEYREAAEEHGTYGAIAGESVSMKDTKTVMVYRVLASLLELGKGVRGATGVSLLEQTIGEKTKHPFACTVLNMNYSDSGIFGVYFAAQPQDAGLVLNGALAALKQVSQNVSQEMLDQAKQQTLIEIIAADEQGSEVISDLSTQTMSNGIYANPQEQMKLVTSVTAQDIQQAAKKILSSKLSVAAYGHLQDFPRLANISV